MEHFFIKFLFTVLLIGLKSDFLVREEHEMVNKDLCGLLQSIFGKDGSVGCNFESELVVVSLLINAEVLHGVLHILDRGIDGVDGDYIDGIIGSLVLLSGNPSAALIDSEVDGEACARIQMADDKVGVQDFES